ncbi:MAG: hypothetical protein ACLVKG_22855, partial [Blautia coccoides]
PVTGLAPARLVPCSAHKLTAVRHENALQQPMEKDIPITVFGCRNVLFLFCLKIMVFLPQ